MRELTAADVARSEVEAMSARQFAENGLPPDFVWCDVREGRDHACANNKPGHAEHVCCCGHVIPPGNGDAAEDDALALALRILAPGEDDNATLGELRREYGIATRPIPPSSGDTAEWKP